MSVVQIPNLPPAISLNGSEQYEAVQAGTSVRVTTAQIGTYIQSQYPAPGVVSIGTSAPITGGTITSSGTIGLATAGVTNTYLASMAAYTIKANVTASAAQPTDATVTSVLDTIGSASGSLLYRGASVWTTLAIGGSNYVLTSNGSAPSWQDPATLVSLTIGSTPIAGGTSGYILYDNGSVLGNKATTGSGNVVLATSPTLVTPNLGTPSSVTLTNATGLPLGSGVTGTLPIANGGTGQTTASAAFNALSPIVSTGDLIIGNGPSSATRLGIGASGYVLTSNGTTAIWSPASAASSITIGTTAINSGTSGRILYDNAGVFGELATTGSGNVVLATSPTLVTPNLGTPSAVTLTNGTGLPLSTGVTGTLATTNGGTGLTTYVTGDTLYASAANTLSRLAIGTTGQVLSVVGGIPAWSSVSSVAVTSFSAGTTGLTPASPTTGAVVLAGTLGIANGGTGQTTASAAFNALSPITSTGDLIIGNGVNSATRLPIGTNGYVLTSDGTTATWAASTGGVTSFSAGTTGLTPSTATTGAVTLAGTLGIANGGTNGTATPTAGAVAYGTGTAYAFTSAGTAGQYLQSNGSSAPVWATVTGGTGSPAYYGLFISTSNQTNGGATTANVVTLDSAVLNNGISVVSSNQITFANAGQYAITAELAITNSVGSNPTLTAWLSQNGTNVANSSQNFQFTGGANNVQMTSCTWIINASAGDYVQLYWSCATTTTSLITQAAGASPTRPAAPSVIVSTYSLPQIGLGYAGLTSTTSTLIGTGSKTFTVNLPDTSDAYAVGSRVRVASSASPSNFMEGVITAYSGTSLTVNVDSTGGSGTIASWNFSIAGIQGNSGLTVGTTTVSGGTSGRVLYDNAGVVGEYTVTGTAGSVVLSASPALTGTPTFAGSSSGTTGLAASATASGTLTLPAATDTLVGKATTDTLTNKTISGSSNTLSNIANASLTNSSITVNGTSISLGGSGTITAAASSITVGTTTVSGGTSTRVLYDNAGTLGEYAQVPIANGGTGQATASAAFNALSPITSTGDLILGNGTNSATRLAIGANGYVLQSNGTTATWASFTSGASISNDTSTSTNEYPLFAAATSGTPTTIYTSNSKLLYKPSTGEFTSTAFVAGNGIYVNNQTVSASYTIAAGYSGMSAGPITVASGQSVTVASGSKWVVL